MRTRDLKVFALGVLTGIGIPIAAVGGGLYLFRRAEAEEGRGYIVRALHLSGMLPPSVTRLWARGVEDHVFTEGCASFVVDPSSLPVVEARARAWLDTAAAEPGREPVTLERALAWARRFDAPRTGRLTETEGLTVLPSGPGHELGLCSDAVVLDSATGRVWFFRFPDPP
jgi:hypothetical protein